MTETVLPAPDPAPDPDPDPARAALDRLAAAGADGGDLAILSRRLDRQAQEMAGLAGLAETYWQDGARLRAALAATYASRSWRITAPWRRWRAGR
jgi:hypothetical protein